MEHGFGLSFYDVREHMWRGGQTLLVMFTASLGECRLILIARWAKRICAALLKDEIGEVGEFQRKAR